MSRKAERDVERLFIKVFSAMSWLDVILV